MQLRESMVKFQPKNVQATLALLCPVALNFGVSAKYLLGIFFLEHLNIAPLQSAWEQWLITIVEGKYELISS